MNILYLGDVMGEPGLRLVEKQLPGLRREHAIVLVIAFAIAKVFGLGDHEVYSV